jgi:hypothetical protein
MTDVTARPWWLWMEGMRTSRGLRVYSVKPPLPLGIREGDQRARPECGALPYNAQPDTEDAATLGCLTQRARELNQCPGLGFYCDHVTGLWLPGDPMWLPPWLANIAARSEWAALVAACDAAPSTSKERSP